MEEMEEIIAALRQSLERLANAAEAYAADQERAPHPECALVQPVTVAEANELNAAITEAREFLGVHGAEF